MTRITRSEWSPRSLAAALPLAAVLLASRAGAADVTLGDLAATAGPVSYRVSKIEIRGTETSPEELSRLFGADPSSSLAERLRRMSAEEVRAPEASAEIRSGEGRLTIVYTDLRATGIKDGRIAAATASGSRLEASGPDGLVRVSTGPVTIADLDLALAAALPEPGAPGPLVPLYGSAALQDIVVGDASGMSVKLDRIVLRDLKARPIAAGWNAAFAALSSQTEPTPPDRLLGVLRDAAGAVSLGSVEATGFGFELGGPDQESARVARIGYGDGASGLTLDGVEIGATQGRLSIAKVTLGAGSGGLAPVSGAADRPAALWRTFSTSGSIRLDQVALATPDRAAVTIGRIEAGLAKGAPGLGAAVPPVTLSVSAQDVAIPTRPDDLALKSLTDLGYSRLAGSLQGAFRYDEAGEQLTVDKLTAHLDGIGDVTLSATLGQVSRKLLEDDSKRAAAAFLDIRAHRLEAVVENGGLAERLVDQQARLSGRKPEDIRRQYGLMAEFAAPMALGPSPGVRALGEATSRFVMKPGRLAVTLTARDAAGIGVADILAAPDPRAVLDRIEIGAAAQ